MFDREYCIKECPIGKPKSTELLESADSIFDAVSDFKSFVENCTKTCKYQNINKNKTGSTKYE